MTTWQFRLHFFPPPEHAILSQHNMSTFLHHVLYSTQRSVTQTLKPVRLVDESKMVSSFSTKNYRCLPTVPNILTGVLISP